MAGFTCWSSSWRDLLLDRAGQLDRVAERGDLRPVRVAQHEAALVAVARQVERGAEQLVDALGRHDDDEAALLVAHVVVLALGQRLERQVVAELRAPHAGDLDAQPEAVRLVLGRPQLEDLGERGLGDVDDRLGDGLGDRVRHRRPGYRFWRHLPGHRPDG